MQDKMTDLTGKKGRALKRWVDKRSNERRDYTIEYPDNITGELITETIPLSQMEAAYWWSMQRRGDALAVEGNDKFNERLLSMGITKDFLSEVDTYVDQEVLDLAVWLSDVMGEHIYQTTNPVHEARYGTSITHSKNYTPVKAEYNAGDPDSDLFSQMQAQATMVKGALHELTNTQIGIKPANLLDVWVDHIYDMNHFAAWAVPIQQMESVFSAPDIKIGRASCRERV